MRALRGLRFRLVRLILWLILAAYTAWLSTEFLNEMTALRQGAVRLPKEPVSDAAGIFHKITFEKTDPLNGWEEKIFKGRTRYEFENEGPLVYLRASSQDSSSGMYYKIDAEVTPDLTLGWWWRAQTFPTKKNSQKLANRSEDDFAARMYVIFMGKSLMRSDVIEYLWDAELPAETISQSPYSDRIQLWVVQSGAPDPAQKNGWVYEERNLYNDYVKAFGKPSSKPLGIIAIMSDSDNTRSAAGADYGDILFKRKPHSMSHHSKPEDVVHAPSP